MQPASDTRSDPRSAPPRVRIVIATRQPGEWFATMAASLADQDYPDVAITIVHEPGDAELLEGPIRALGDVDLLEVEEGTGFGAKINRGIAESEDPLVLICHDDVALEPGALSALVRERLRRGEPDTLVAPKLVDWTSPDRLARSVFDADRFGETVSLVKPGDLDQGQHDRAAEVFGVSTACVLVDHAFFERIGGFDEAMDWHGEDHELAVRSRVAGGRVVVASAAVVRHRAAFAERGGPPPAVRERRHQLRSILSVPSGFGMVRLLVGVAVLHALEFAIALIRLDLDELRSIPGAWLWNARHLGSVGARRRPLSEFRHDSAADLKRARRQGSIRVAESIDRRITQRELAAERGDQEFSVVRVAGATVIVSLLGFGARHLLTRPIPVVGEFRRLPSDLGTLTSDWWSGWRTFGMGGEGFASFALPLLDLAGLATFGSESFLRLLLVVAPLPIGVLGAWRLFAGADSLRAPVAAAALYAASPLPYNAIAGGSLRAMLLYASLPWMLAHLISLAGSPIVGPPRRPRVSVVALATLLALVGAFEPWVGVTFATLVVGVFVGSFLAGDMRGVLRLTALAVVAAAVAAAVNAPYLVGLRTWAEFGTAQTDVGNELALHELLTLATGPTGSAVFGWAVFVVALFPIVSGGGLRFTWAMRLWGVMLGAWALAWAGARGWLPVGLPVAEVLLAPVALGMAGLGGIAALVLDRDLVDAPTRRMVPAALAAAGLVVALLPLLDGSFSGRWSLARADLDTSLAAIEGPVEDGTYRVIWIGDAHVLGSAAIPAAGGLAWSTSLDGAPDVRALWGGADDGATAILSESIGAGLDGRTSRLGRELSRFGVRYLVVMDQQAPVPEVSRREPVIDGRASGLGTQLDLVRTGVVNPAVVVYENTAWAQVHTAVPPTALQSVRLDDPAPAVTTRTEHVRWTGQVREARSFYAAWEPSPRWVLTIADQAIPRVDLGPVGMGFDTTASGTATDAVFEYRTPDAHRLVAGAQVAAWVILLVLRRGIVGVERRRSRMAAAGAPS